MCIKGIRHKKCDKVDQMKIVILIRALNQGGAQRQVVNLANALAIQNHQVTVCVFYCGEQLEDRLLKSKIALVSLDKQNRWDIFGPLRRFYTMLLRESPDVLYSFLGGSNILSGLAKLFSSHYKVLWGIRSSNMDLNVYDNLSKLIFIIEQKMSFLPDLIIANSHAGQRHLIDIGFPPDKIRVVHNGIDTRQFYVDGSKKDILKDKLNYRRSHFLVGLVARIDPKKDHENFIKAAALLASKRRDINFVIIGRGDKQQIIQLEKLMDQLKLADRMRFLGPQQDMNTMYNGLDLLCLSSSFGEGFPNVLGEAMACGIPCVATSVGDSAVVLGDTGLVVPPHDHHALSEAMEQMIKRIEMDKDNIKHRVLKRVNDNFLNHVMVSRTLSLFASVDHGR